MLSSNSEVIDFEMTEGMLHLRPATILGNIIQDAHRKMNDLSILLRNDEAQVEVDPRLNVHILAEASNLAGNVYLSIQAPEHIDEVDFRNVVRLLREEINSFVEISWDEDSFPDF